MRVHTGRTLCESWFFVFRFSCPVRGVCRRQVVGVGGGGGNAINRMVQVRTPADRLVVLVLVWFCRCLC